MKILFFYPHRQRVSGGLTYFYELAKFIGENTEHETYVMNFRYAHINNLYKNTSL
ncbi:hypothetical protein IAR72_001678, partial [Campylobacter coli]|nr:hypothetical protein [Campylobacter coli]